MLSVVSMLFTGPGIGDLEMLLIGTAMKSGLDVEAIALSVRAAAEIVVCVFVVTVLPMISGFASLLTRPDVREQAQASVGELELEGQRLRRSSSPYRYSGPLASTVSLPSPSR